MLLAIKAIISNTFISNQLFLDLSLLSKHVFSPKDYQVVCNGLNTCVIKAIYFVTFMQ